MFGLETLQGKIIAKSPLHHGGDEKTGAETLLRRNKFVVNNDVIEVPYISGNAVRGVLRRMVMADFLELAGYQITNLRLYHALFTGGILESVDEKNSGIIDMGLKQKIIRLLPPIALFGTSLGNQIIEGKLHVGLLLPVCNELNAYLPSSLQGNRSVFDFLDFTHQTRKDDRKEERNREEQAVQMLVNHEVFIAGTIFFHEIKIEDTDAVIKGVMARALQLWKHHPFIGGKSSIGFGKLDINYDKELDAQPYLDFIKQNKKEIVSLLKELDDAKKPAKAR